MNDCVPENEGSPAGGRARRRGLVSRLLVPAVALSLGLAGCASVEAPPASNSVAAAPTEQKPAPPPASPERKRLIDAFGGEYRAPATETYLNAVLVKLAQVSDAPSQPYRVTLLDSPVVNAFALPSGDIFMTRGLIALADDTSEIAAVMAHEIAHVTARHAAQRAEYAKTTALFARVNQQVLERSQAPEEAEARSRLSLASFSREQEFEADQIGIKAIARAGYDPYAAARFLTALGEWSALTASISGAPSADRPDMMATHPSTPERIAQAQAEARALGSAASGETGRDAYLAAIDGLLFGDDPSQGVLRGSLFIHPKLGFAFEAPSGFTLENQSAALIGVGDSGAEALRLDSIPISDSTSVASAIASGWIDGVKTTDVETLQIGGLEAATAAARGDQWSFRLGAVRLNGRLYRLIFAARSLSPAVDQRFRASLESFHLINARDSALASPQAIKIVAAGGVDTADTLAARMAFLPRALDQFLILNGLERGAPLVQGQRYKVVSQ
jgi:predicted Zn-dependent protease